MLEPIDSEDPPQPPTPPPATPAPRPRRKPIFGIASWVAPAVETLISWGIVSMATEAARARGEWFPGLLEAIICGGIIILTAFVCGLTAMLRRERWPWLGVGPFLASCTAIAYLIYDRWH